MLGMNQVQSAFHNLVLELISIFLGRQSTCVNDTRYNRLHISRICPSRSAAVAGAYAVVEDASVLPQVCAPQAEA